MILQLIQEHLEKQKFDCVFMEASPEIPIDRLLVNLDIDGKKRSRLLEIGAIQLQMPPEIAHPHAADFPFRLQFRVLLPFKVEDLALSQVASLVLFLNQSMDLPGFELNELKGQVCYRYIWMMKQSACDSMLLTTIIGAIMLNLSLFADMIESLANGQMTFNDLLSKVLKMMEEFPSNSPPV